MALLDAIVEAAGNPTDGGVREFSARCQAEFLKWSSKHATSKKVLTRAVLLANCAAHRNKKKQLMQRGGNIVVPVH
jgi:hypothetical protein